MTLWLRSLRCSFALALMLFACVAHSQDAAELYRREIKPLLKERCFACHGSLKQEAGLRLDTASSILKGGESGAAVVVGDEKSSPLMERVTSSDLSVRMPPEGAPLTQKQIESLQTWIRHGAKGIVNEAPEPDPRDHWAFRLPVKPAIPEVASTSNPIDAFLLSRLQKEGLSARPLADKATWLRRVTIDLIGLPPTREEMLAFEADQSAAAYERVVDRLLADPRYGERWGRHWMDVWRYADWHGRRYVPDVWNSAPQIWRWRDWIVESLNEDRGYDEMVREMLAADEIAPEDDRAASATGYLIRNWYALNPNDWMRANVEHVGKAFLGLTFNCAHCHDHKYDPISQENYFQLRAFFEPIGIRQDRVLGEADPGPFQEYDYSVLRKVQRLGQVRIYDRQPGAKTWFYTGGDERNRVTEKGSIVPGVPAFLTKAPLTISSIKLPVSATHPTLRPEWLAALRAEQQSKVSEAEKAIANAAAEIEKDAPALRSGVAIAKEGWQASVKKFAGDKSTAPLKGNHSLLLSAVQGRRIIQHRLSELKPLEKVSQLSFQVQLVQDAHFNFQLAKDLSKGLTAGFVGFDRGKILSYQSGTFTEFQAGEYKFTAGQRRFEVALTFEPLANRCLLSVRCLDDDKLLVDQAPVALNDWDPARQPKNGILFDARTGSIAGVDEIIFQAPTKNGDAESVIAFDFEAPTYVNGNEVVGCGGWQASHLGDWPATSLVSSVIAGDELIAPSQKLHAALRVLAACEMKLEAAKANLAAAQTELESLDAIAAAEQARLGVSQPPNMAQLNGAASQLQLDAAQKVGESEAHAADQALAAAESLPVADPQRVAAISAAKNRLAAARGTIDEVIWNRMRPPTKRRLPDLFVSYPAESTGRRKALAEWITSRENPLAARVAVNHIWMRHFHAPLVASVFDFGRAGAPPTHPELLDYLAIELIESGWSMKHLHRLIVTSNAYRRASSVENSEAVARDPENKLLWRMNRGRMEAEVVRDSLLFLAGRLDNRMGGQELENEAAFTTFRRTLYYSCQPELDGKSQFGVLFDAPEPNDCYRRTKSTIPQQALALTNSDLVQQVSIEIADRLSKESTDASAYVALAFETILNRPPTAEETQTCQEFLSPTTDGPDFARQRASLVRALLNHHDFISIR